MSLSVLATWLPALFDAGHNILGVPWWLWAIGGLALAALALIAAPELIAFAPEALEAGGLEGLGLEGSAAEAVALQGTGLEGAGLEGALADAEVSGGGPSTYVLGHGDARLAYEGLEGFGTLNVPNWSVAVNDAWIASGIEDNASFLLTSDVGPETMVGQAAYDYTTVYARELEQLFNAGYTPLVDAVGNILMVPP